ncbi:phage recombination protein Bet [Paraburkholderia sp.]|uniref:phage recombination protein Bet n=1 Tax=Paraburkholderia sp. TaxID=1926495 RepID=UPI003C7E2E2D
MSNALTQRESASLPSMQVEEKELIDVLRNSLYPGAQDASIKLVLSYCKAAGLDPMQKPVHIVPMQVSTGKKDDDGWDIKENRDTIMPGVGLYRSQAERTGLYAGISEPEYGPMLELTFIADVWENVNGKRVKRSQNVTMKYPEWCRVTVEKFLDGKLCRYTAVEYWIENYATKSNKTEEPNSMWKRRPRGQLAKCAEAQALRKAFPGSVGSQPTAEEMEGKSLLEDDRTIDMPPTQTPVAQPQSRSEKAKAATPGDVTDVDAKPAAAQGAQQAPAEGAAEPVVAKPISDSMLTVLKKKMENAGVNEADLKRKFSIDLDGVTTANYNSVTDWLKDPTQ